MIPLKDENKSETTPFVTIIIIFLNCAVFVWEALSPLEASHIARLYGAIPLNLTSFKVTPNAYQPISPLVSVITSMFLHGNILHLGGNMLYLWIFGDNIEDTLGHVRFAIFYLFSGFVAAYVFAFSGPGSELPMIGASGAVSGVLGAYILLFPSARVITLVFFGLIWISRIPALIVIGLWAVLQLLNGFISETGIQSGGVAWFAHIGGFLAGLLTIRLWLPRKRYTRF
ncbi:MAG TPA: rhomboid family intramembrane serine protease [Dissulfurispiraceae bacterium]|nr:rhomboid family intramembrane serine protease [Dissulfurispiraceae bacterium]